MVHQEAGSMANSSTSIDDSIEPKPYGTVCPKTGDIIHQGLCADMGNDHFAISQHLASVVAALMGDNDELVAKARAEMQRIHNIGYAKIHGSTTKWTS